MNMFLNASKIYRLMEKVYVKNIGISGIEPPKDSCNDKKCAWHGKIRIHGRIFKGKVIEAKHKHVLVEFYRYVYIPKYERYEVRRTRIKAHNPPCINAKEGDTVLIGETRPLSKTIHFVVIQKLPSVTGAIVEKDSEGLKQ